MTTAEVGTGIGQLLRQAGALIGGRSPRRATRMEAPDLVLLVPGFLGFSRFGGFYYFAERVVAALRGLLEEALGYPVPVVPCTTLPTGRLVKRQVRLIETLKAFCGERLSGVERIHVVGHSTGGVDAQLLACTRLWLTMATCLVTTTFRMRSSTGSPTAQASSIAVPRLATMSSSNSMGGSARPF
jgi:pimeloyl-ACP methyl ester carboxylesterase